MNNFNAINLSALMPPDIIERLDFETIVKELRDDLVERFPPIAGVIDLESEPARKLIEAFAYREMLLRGRVNDAARAVMLSSSYGNNLDHLAALFGVQRGEVQDETGALVIEDDERLRRRVQLAPDAFSVAGPEGAYVHHALTVASWARDASAISPAPGRVRVTMLRSGADPTPSFDEREQVKKFLANDNVRPLTDMVQVGAPTIKRTSIIAKLILYHGPDANVVKDRAIASLTEWVEQNRMLGRNLRRSAIFARLHQEGVHSVQLDAPAADLVLDPTEVYAIDETTITVAELRDE
jgi:phage-related baseplate assembly protein